MSTNTEADKRLWPLPCVLCLKQRDKDDILMLLQNKPDHGRVHCHLLCDKRNIVLFACSLITIPLTNRLSPSRMKKSTNARNSSQLILITKTSMCFTTIISQLTCWFQTSGLCFLYTFILCNKRHLKLLKSCRFDQQ